MKTCMYLLLILTLAVMQSFGIPSSFVKRRFGEEQGGTDLIRQLRGDCNDNTGVFDQIAGGFISQLLAATDACGRYAAIDQIITLTKEKNCTQQGIDVARKLCALEKNFNPFAGAAAKPAFCNDPALPKSPEVKCIVPIIDPSVNDAEQYNIAAQARLVQVQGGNFPDCNGLSVQEQAIALGVPDCLKCNIGEGGNSNVTSIVPNSNNGTSTGTVLVSGSGTSTSNVTSIVPNSNNGTSTGTVLVPGSGTNTDGNNGSNSSINNVNLFKETLLGAKPVVVNDLGEATIRRFDVLNEDGSSNGDFLNKKGALERACAIQKNKCADAANSAGGIKDGVSVSDCEALSNRCNAKANG